MRLNFSITNAVGNLPKVIEGIGLAKQRIIPSPHQNDPSAVSILIPTVSPSGGSGLLCASSMGKGDDLHICFGRWLYQYPGTIAGWPNPSQKNTNKGTRMSPRPLGRPRPLYATRDAGGEESLATELVN